MSSQVKKNIAIIDSHHYYDGGSNLYFNMIRSYSSFEIITFESLSGSPIFNLLIKIYLSKYFNKALRYNLTSFFAILYLKFLIEPIVFKNLKYYLSNKLIGTVWISSNGIIPNIGVKLKRYFNSKIHCSMHDVPYTYKYSFLYLAFIKRAELAWINSIDSIDVVTDEMRDYFFKKIQRKIPNLITYSSIGISKDDINCDVISKNCDGIVFVGSPRFIDNINIFCDALLQINGNYRLNSYSHYSLCHNAIINMGYFKEPALISKLKLYKLAYCPLSFDEKDMLLVRTSFPGKIASYLKAGIPLFIHAPKYSALANFVEVNNIGVICSSKNIIDIKKAYSNYYRNEVLMNIHRENISKVIDKFFKEDIRFNFYRNLG